MARDLGLNWCQRLWSAAVLNDTLTDAADRYFSEEMFQGNIFRENLHA